MDRERRYDIDWLKLLIVTAISFPLTLALYELLVRRFNAMRFLSGMRPRKRLQAT